MSLVGSRVLPIEDVPDDAFGRALPRELAVAPWQRELVDQALALYAPGKGGLLVKRMRPLGAGVFGGRWLPDAVGIVVYWHEDREIERAVLLHEVCHYLRWLYGRDVPGHHDDSFLALVEEVYRTFGVRCQTAKLVEGQYPQTWDW